MSVGWRREASGNNTHVPWPQWCPDPPTLASTNSRLRSKEVSFSLSTARRYLVDMSVPRGSKRGERADGGLRLLAAQATRECGGAVWQRKGPRRVTAYQTR